MIRRLSEPGEMWDLDGILGVGRVLRLRPRAGRGGMKFSQAGGRVLAKSGDGEGVARSRNREETTVAGARSLRE